MLRIAEQWVDSDLGRQRQGNEDNYFVRAPLFVVADGMGGAQAGEVASEMAVESFADGLPPGPPEQGLVQIIERANQRIHERSRTEQKRAGMGTTVTAAYVAEDTVWVAHVGDSRCYVLRDGDLIRLTHDHSLVEELMRRGKLTAEQAESHPQRSVITRALGPEASVEVDISPYPAKSGDLFLLCSDGLTSMVHEPKLKPLMVEPRPLADLGRDLIAAANAAGGRDNITVVLFRLEEVEAQAGAPAAATDGAAADAEDATTEYDTFAGEAVSAPRQGVSRPPEARTRLRDEAARAGGMRASDEAEAEYRASGTVALSAVRPRAQPIEEPRPHAPPPPRRRRRRRLVTPARVIVLGAVVGILIALWVATREIYFLGVDEAHGNVVAVYRGLPYELPLGIKLYSVDQRSGVTLQSVPGGRRKTFTDHQLRARKDAENLLLALEQGRISG
jgi:PPM family protein phosphatase